MTATEKKFYLGTTPGKSGTVHVGTGTHLSGKRVYQDLKPSAEDATVLGISQAMRRTCRDCYF